MSTGSLGWSEIRNKAEYKSQLQSVSVSSANDGAGAFVSNMPSGMLIAYNHGDSASGTTGSAISEGTLEVRDPARQQQDVATLSRDPSRANDSVSPIFDKEKEQKRLQQVQLIGEIGTQAMDILRTQGQLDADKAARAELEARGISAPDAGASERQVEDYRKALLGTNAYQDIMGKYGTGGDYQKAAQAVTAALQGLAGGDIGSALAGASSPYVAGVIKQVAGDNDTARIMAHAVLGAVVAQAQGNSAAAGGAGAAGSELAAQVISERLYGTRDSATLNEAQKQTITALASLAGGLAGSVVDGSSGGAIAGAAGGKNATENNFLGGGTPPGLISYGQAASSLTEYMRKNGATAEEITQAQRDLAQGQGFDGVQPANEFIKAWGEAMVAEAAGLGIVAGLGRFGLWGAKGATPVVTAEGRIGNSVFTDVNQTARPAAQANPNQPTLIADRVDAKIAAKGTPHPNGNMADAHAEIGVIQKAFNEGKTVGSDMTMNVVGKDVCGYCRGDIAAAASKSGLKSLTIQAKDDITGLPKTYYWEVGMKSIREKKI
ncbi:VENN motif pre-toxin domain-containing protein [Pseudomonas aeruginosa]|uniref:VENN motif pre-toxin domain-containing protein n=1 Tax=Pseudomonas aeruginosa TaxID=287 RepID=UPI001FC9EE2B|nr:VENN motif pre-toxin domain-containing protein [Pseudomonas aeruginosa]